MHRNLVHYIYQSNKSILKEYGKNKNNKGVMIPNWYIIAPFVSSREAEQEGE